MFIMCLLALGLTQPGGIMQYHDLQKMYHHCSLEDHDITPLDFVFEHLLNLESIVNLIESEHELPETDQSHETFEAAPSAILVLATPPGPSQFDISKSHVLFFAATTHFSNRNDFYKSQFFFCIFRPPIC
jgi:hypothetical protein